MNLILMGAPGAGKGTQSEKISAKWGIPAVSTGQILRAAIKSGTELGEQAKALIDAGQFVPDEVVIAIIKETLSSKACEKGFILDGFPRSISQAIALEEMGVHIDCVLSLEVADEVIIERMTGRRLCSKCGSSYHVDHKPTAVAGVCDKCKGELITRADDKPEVIKSRLDVYHEQTEPLKDFYAAKGVLKMVIGQEKIEDTTALTIAAIESIRG